MIEFNPSKGEGLMEVLSKSSGKKIIDGVLQLPETFAKGYIKRIDLGPMMNLMIHQYVLTKNTRGKRMKATAPAPFITFSFRNIFPPVTAEQTPSVKNVRYLPSVQVSSAGIDLDFSFPAHTEINTFIINVHEDVLKDWISKEEDGDHLLKPMVSGTKPYLYEELISPKVREIAAQLLKEEISGELAAFYYKIKAQELIFLFLLELIKRKDITMHAFHSEDVNMIYQIRDQVIKDLSTPPNMAALCIFSGMSESKMNRLFR